MVWLKGIPPKKKELSIFIIKILYMKMYYVSSYFKGKYFKGKSLLEVSFYY